MKTEIMEVDKLPRRPRTRAVSYRPQTDAEAKGLIEELGHYVWETQKVSGRFAEHPYSLVALIDGHPIVIHLRGRRGTVLTWLRDKRDAMEQTPPTYEDGTPYFGRDLEEWRDSL